MENVVDFSDVYAPSDDVVVREIEGENLIIPIASGVGDMEDELYSLNESGKIIWDKLDGKKTLDQVAIDIIDEYEDAEKEIKDDVINFVTELVKRNILVKV
jgi:hypothetical protein